MRSNLLRLILVFLMAAATPAAWAAIIPVTTTIDESDGSCEDSDCSLRDAVATAASGDTVQIPAGHYVLTLGQIALDKDLTISGAGARTTVLDGNHMDRVIAFSSGTPATISDVALVNGLAAGGDPNSIDNAGGAILGAGAPLKLERCLIANNQADVGGGVLWIGGPATIDGCTFTGNQAIGNSENPALGGGLALIAGVHTISNSTFSGNAAASGGTGGGVVFESSEIHLFNVTITANQAGPGNGGGLADLADLADSTLTNTIIAGNSGGDCLFSGNFAIANHSLDSDGSCELIYDPDSLPGVNPLLGPLANNGGPTDTHALLAGSPAIDAGDNATCLPTDQRGVARPQGPACDMGAYEAEVNNAPPDCSGAAPSVARIWPPNHKMVPVSIQGVTDPDGGPVSIQISQVHQDEPTNSSGDGNTCPDAQGLGAATASVRAERSGQGNGRVYTLSFTATDDQGASCQGSVNVCVPHSSQGNCVDNGPQFDSTVCSSGSALSTMSSGHSHKSISSGLSLPCGSHFPTLECDLECDAGVLICQ